MNTLKPRIASLLQQLNERVFEKEHIVALALLSAVAGESIFLLGPPGVAKSMVGRRLKLAFRNASGKSRKRIKFQKLPPTQPVQSYLFIRPVSVLHGLADTNL